MLLLFLLFAPPLPPSFPIIIYIATLPMSIAAVLLLLLLLLPLLSVANYAYYTVYLSLRLRIYFKSLSPSIQTASINLHGQFFCPHSHAPAHAPAHTNTNIVLAPTLSHFEPKHFFFHHCTNPMHTRNKTSLGLFELCQQINKSTKLESKSQQLEIKETVDVTAHGQINPGWGPEKYRN